MNNLYDSHDPRDASDLVRLVKEYPLAWIVSNGAAGFAATALPMVAEPNEADEIVSLMGHFALRNPHVEVLRATLATLVALAGCESLRSTDTVARFDVDIELLPQANGEALRKLVDHMERDRRVPWTIAKMGERYERILPHIIAFRAHVRGVGATFNLGQEETPQTFTEILAAMQDETLARWMRDFNPGR